MVSSWEQDDNHPDRKTGLARIRYIGFTGHKDPLVHLRMLEIAVNHKFRLDAVQMPLNLMDACEASVYSGIGSPS